MLDLIKLAACLSGRTKGEIVEERQTYVFEIQDQRLSIQLRQDLKEGLTSWCVNFGDEEILGDPKHSTQSRIDLRKTLNKILNDEASCGKCPYCNFVDTP